MSNAIIENYTEKYTYSDYQSWEGDWELINGVPYAMTPSPGFSHQYIAGKILRLLDEQLEGCPHCHVLFEIDWNISDDTIVRPDIMIVCGHSGERIVKTPHLIFEIVSKQNAKRDEILKFELYKKEGVQYYGIVYPEFKKVRLFKSTGSDYKKISDFTNETYSITINDCEIAINFQKIWP